MDDLSCEGNAHLDTQRLEECQEEGQHLIGHIWGREGEDQVQQAFGLGFYLYAENIINCN